MNKKAQYRTRVYFPTLIEDDVLGMGETPEDSLRDALSALGIERDLSFQARSVAGILRGWSGLPAGLQADLETVN